MRTAGRTFLGIALSLFAVSTAANAQSVSVVTTGSGSLSNSVGSAIAKAVNEKAGLRMVVTPMQNHGHQEVDSGGAEFSVSTFLEAYVQGREPWVDRPLKNVRMVSNLFPLRAGVYVRKESDIRTLADLRGRKIFCEYAAQPTIMLTYQAHLAVAGMTLEDMQCQVTQNVVSAANGFASGRADSFIFALGSGKVKEVSASVGGLRVLPFAGSPEDMAKARKFLPGIYPYTEKPNPTAEEITEPTPVLAWDLIFFSGTHVSDEIVYKVTKAIHENKPDLVSVFRGLALFDPAKMAREYDDVQYHPGAIKFYQEKGMWPPKAN